MPKKAMPIYTMQRYITDTDVDIAQRLKPSAMFGMFQDIAALHAANLGASVAFLREEYGVAWILMRIRLEIDRFPMLAQDVIVETWPQEPRALYERDYSIKGSDGETLVRAASTWIIMDIETREIKRSRFFDYFGIDMNTDRAIGRGVGRLKPEDGAELVYEKGIRFSDVDYNGHVNNAKYVDFVLDSFSFEEHRERELKAIEMHYINESGPGDVLGIRRKRLDAKTDYLDGVRAGDGASVINALAEWAIL